MRTCEIWWKIENRQFYQKPSIILPEEYWPSWWGPDKSWFDWELFWSITNMLRDSSKTENYCRSWPVKFDEKSKIDNSIRNHPLSFQSNTDHLDEVMINFGLISYLFDAYLTCSVIVQKMKIIAGPDLWNLMKNWKSTILSETIHNTSRGILTISMRSW